MMKDIFYKKNNCFIISKTCGIFSFQSFKTIQCIINQNKKVYKKVCFKKIPRYNEFIYIKPGEVILEFLIFNTINDFFKIIKIIAYKISLRLKICIFKN